MSFNFGTPTNQQQNPAVGTATPSFNFGASSTPAATSAPAFGSFGASGTASTGVSFGGATTATVAPLSFGATNTNTNTAGGLGGTSGFSLGGTQPATASVAPTTGLSFGATQPASTGLSFGTTQPASTGLSFGTTPQAAVAPTTGLSFGAAAPQSTASTGLSFGQPAASSSSGLSFGSTTANKPGSLFGAATSAAPSAAPLTFGNTAATSTASTGLSFGTPQAQPALNLGGAAAPTAAAAPPAIGLGGSNVGIGTSTSVATTTDSKSTTSGQNHKETAIPNELLETVEEFKKFVKEERSISSDIAHVSPKVHKKIAEEIAAMNQLVSTLMTGLSRNHALLDKIKVEAAQEILNAEIAQRTKDTPRGLQYENVAPYEYFTRLVLKFEGQMVHYRRQIEETQQHLISMASGQSISPDDIAKALQKLHTAFVGLAGRYQSIHESVFSLSESFVQWHRQRHGTSIELYPTKKISAKSTNPTNFATGPSPFVGKDLFAQAKAAISAQAPAQQVPHQNPQVQGMANQSMFGGNTTSGTPFGQGVANQSTSLFANNTLNQSSLATPNQGLLGQTMSPFGANTAQSSPFQTGGKRGKH